MMKELPLKLKLPLLMSLVLAGTVGVALLATYTSLRRTQIQIVQERLTRATRQLATLGAAGIAAQQARFLPVANDSAIRRGLAAMSSGRAASTAPVEKALTTLVTPADSGLPAELWTADGRRVAHVGTEARVRMRVAPGKPELPMRLSFVADADTGRLRDSLRVGPLYADAGRVYFWFTMPVRDRDKTIGYITQQRRLAIGPNAQRTLRDLSGDSVSLYYRNIDGGFWASGTGVAAAGLRVDTVRSSARDSSNDRVLYHEERIGSTPLVATMSIPERFVLARPWRSFEPVIYLAALLTILGIAIAWAIGARVARPVTQITTAAEALATGDYDARVPEQGDLEVRQLATAFNKMAAEIQEGRTALQAQTQQARAASNAKSDFLTIMSHELRTPLNAIGGYVDLLEMELRGPITATQKRDLERIKQSQQHLLGLISGVLDLARVEAGKISYDLAALAVDPFLSGLDALVAPQAASKQIDLAHEPSEGSLAVIADREKLRQIVLNLLSNAIRHTPPGGKITLSASPSMGNVVIVIEDTGPGIPADKADQVFEPFVQLDRSLRTNRDGLGLGLSISRDLARGMSGDLRVEARDGQGARFLLTLPRGNPSLAEEPHTGETRVVSRA